VPIQGQDCVLVPIRPIRPIRERLLVLWLAATPLLTLMIVVGSDAADGRRSGAVLDVSTVLARVYLLARLRRDLRLRHHRRAAGVVRSALGTGRA
jgi:hypothetical protein